MAGDQRSVTRFTRAILIAFSLAITCLTFPSVILGCERNGPLAVVPLDGEWQPYFELVGATELFKVRRIEGVLESRHFVINDGKHADEDTPLRRAGLTLRNALSGDIIKSSTTEDNGHFDLGDVPPGSYFLQILKEGEPKKPLSLNGSLIIEVHMDAKDAHLPRLALSMSDCGMNVHRKNDENSSNNFQNFEKRKSIIPSEEDRLGKPGRSSSSRERLFARGARNQSFEGARL